MNNLSLVDGVVIRIDNEVIAPSDLWSLLYSELKPYLNQELARRNRLGAVDVGTDRRLAQWMDSSAGIENRLSAELSIGGKTIELKPARRTNQGHNFGKIPSIILLNDEYGMPQYVLRHGTVREWSALPTAKNNASKYNSTHLIQFHQRLEKGLPTMLYPLAIDTQKSTYLAEPFLTLAHEILVKEGMRRILPEIKVLEVNEQSQDVYSLREWMPYLVQDISLTEQVQFELAQHVAQFRALGIMTEPIEDNPYHLAKISGSIVNFDPDFVYLHPNDRHTGSLFSTFFSSRVKGEKDQRASQMIPDTKINDLIEMAKSEYKAIKSDYEGILPQIVYGRNVNDLAAVLPSDIILAH
jgi:hypothetical protein